MKNESGAITHAEDALDGMAAVGSDFRVDPEGLGGEFSDFGPVTVPFMVFNSR